jgi:hypothetical protein
LELSGTCSWQVCISAFDKEWRLAVNKKAHSYYTSDQDMSSSGVEMSLDDSEYSLKPAEELPLTDDCHHYQGKHEVPWDIQK